MVDFSRAFDLLHSDEPSSAKKRRFQLAVKPPFDNLVSHPCRVHIGGAAADGCACIGTSESKGTIAPLAGRSLHWGAEPRRVVPRAALIAAGSELPDVSFGAATLSPLRGVNSRFSDLP